MTMIQVSELITRCLQNNESPKNFRNLYNQLLHKTHIEPASMFDDIRNFQTGILAYYYAFEVFNYDLGIDRLFDTISDIKSIEIQCNFLKLLLQEQKHMIKNAELESSLRDYLTKALQSTTTPNDEFLLCAVNLVSALKIQLPLELVNQIVTSSGTDKQITSILSNQMTGTTTTTASNTTTKSNNINLTKFTKVKKIIWLNDQILNYKVKGTNFDEFVSSFIKLIPSTGTTSSSSSHSYIINELLSGSFDCLNLITVSANGEQDDISFVNWEYFIVNKLPLMLSKELKIVNHESFEAILEKTLPILTNGKVKASFLKSLLCLKLIKLEMLRHFLGGENMIEINELLKLQNESQREHTRFEENGNYFQDLIQKDLLEINPEFTTIDEDNKLFNFMNKFNISNLALKLEFAQTITNTIVQLCDEKDSSRLRRLFFCLSSNFKCLDTVIFNSDPSVVLNKLIEVCCKSDYLNNNNNNQLKDGTTKAAAASNDEDVSMFGDDGDDNDDNDDDDDSQNYQELYTDYSCMLMHILLISKRYNVAIPTQNSFILKLLENFKPYSSINNVEAIDDVKLQEWYNSIYNDNESLISDDLIAMTNLVSSFQLIPIIFNQSMIAYADNQMSFELLMNGFEFFMQPVLVINLIPIFYKMNEFLWLNPGSELVWQVISKLLELKKFDMESRLMFELIWKFLTPDLAHWKNFKLDKPNANYEKVINAIHCNADQQRETKLSYESAFIENLNLLSTNPSSSQQQPQFFNTSVFYTKNKHNFSVNYYKIIDSIIREISSLTNYNIDNLNVEDKNLNYANYLELSSFVLLTFLAFDKAKYSSQLEAFLATNNNDNTTTVTTSNALDKFFMDLKYLQKIKSNDAFYQACLIRLIEKSIQHLSNL